MWAHAKDGLVDKRTRDKERLLVALRILMERPVAEPSGSRRRHQGGKEDRPRASQAGRKPQGGGEAPRESAAVRRVACASPWAGPIVLPRPRCTSERFLSRHAVRKEPRVGRRYGERNSSRGENMQSTLRPQRSIRVAATNVVVGVFTGLVVVAALLASAVDATLRSRRRP